MVAMATPIAPQRTPPAALDPGPRPRWREAVSFSVAPGPPLRGGFRRTACGDFEYVLGMPGDAPEPDEGLIVRFGPADLVVRAASGAVTAVRCTHRASTQQAGPVPALRPAPGRLLVRPGGVQPGFVCLAHPDAAVARWSERTGWVLVAPLGDERRPVDRYVEFADGVVAGLEDGRLAALWLLPGRELGAANAA